MTTVGLTLNKNEVNTIERGVGTITVGTGKLVVVPFGGAPSVVSESETFDAGNVPVTILALEGTNYGAEYTEPTGTEPPPVDPTQPSIETTTETVRGDSGGDSGAFESRTVKELRALAAERGVEIHSHAKKAEIIAALRA